MTKKTVVKPAVITASARATPGAWSITKITTRIAPNMGRVITEFDISLVNTIKNAVISKNIINRLNSISITTLPPITLQYLFLQVFWV